MVRREACQSMGKLVDAMKRAGGEGMREALASMIAPLTKLTQDDQAS